MKNADRTTAAKREVLQQFCNKSDFNATESYLIILCWFLWKAESYPILRYRTDGSFASPQ